MYFVDSCEQIQDPCFISFLRYIRKIIDIFNFIPIHAISLPALSKKRDECQWQIQELQNRGVQSQRGRILWVG